MARQGRPAPVNLRLQDGLNFTQAVVPGAFCNVPVYLVAWLSMSARCDR